MTMTVTEEETRLETTDDAGNATHIVWLPPHLREKTTPQAYVMEARVEGRTIEALCGHRWVPQRDPRQYPICQRCLDIYHSPGENRDDRDELPEA